MFFVRSTPVKVHKRRVDAKRIIPCASYVCSRHMLPDIVNLFDAVDADSSGEIVIEDMHGVCVLVS